VVTAQRLARCSYRIQRVAFARAAGGSSWLVDLDHPFAALGQEASHAGAVAAGAL
jgi:hypothetical protein